MAAKYSRLSPSEKPSVQKCTLCQEPTFRVEVCPISGFYHNQEKSGRTICGVSLESDARQVSTSQLVEYINKLKITWQKARIEKVCIDESSASLLQSFCRSIQWTPTVYGILYGRYDEATKAVEIHSIYEAENIYKGGVLNEIYDDRIRKVDHLANLLGLKRMGIIVAHSQSENEDILRGEELLWGIQNQSRFGENCVIVTLTPDVENGSTNVEAWQTSEQSVHLFRAKYLSVGNEPGTLLSSIDVDIAVSKDNKPKTSTVSSSNEIDVKWLIAPTAIEAFQSPLLSNRFVRIYRVDNQPPNFDNLRIFMSDPQKRKMSFLEKVNDFHLLIYLMESILDPDVDLPLLIKAIQTKDAQSVEGIKLMIDSCIGEL